MDNVEPSTYTYTFVSWVLISSIIQKPDENFARWIVKYESSFLVYVSISSGTFKYEKGSFSILLPIVSDLDDRFLSRYPDYN